MRVEDPLFGDPTEDFVFTDGSTEGLNFFRVGQGNFPWDNGEPEDPAFGDDENCVE